MAHYKIYKDILLIKKGSNLEHGWFFSDSCLRDSVHTFKDSPVMGENDKCMGIIQEATYKPMDGIYATILTWDHVAKNSILKELVDMSFEIDVLERTKKTLRTAEKFKLLDVTFTFDNEVD